MGILEIRNLSVSFKTSSGPFKAVDGIDLSLEGGAVHAIVGESGSGKSVSMLAVMGLLPWTASVSADVMNFDGIDLLGISSKERRKIIGKDLAMIFQEPMSSLNPCFTVGWQIRETLREHMGMSKAEAQKRVVELFDLVGIPDPEKRTHAFPHQLSGGMNQRVMIAMALACDPKLLIADEPTTALDVTIQAQILDLLRDLHQRLGMTLILITHDMGVVAEMAQRVSVQYAGQKVEEQAVEALFRTPRHPYTQALLNALPARATSKILPTIPGVVPGQFERPRGCLFAPRCDFATEICHETPPESAGENKGQARCHHVIEYEEVKA